MPEEPSTNSPNLLNAALSQYTDPEQKEQKAKKRIVPFNEYVARKAYKAIEFNYGDLVAGFGGFLLLITVGGIVGGLWQIWRPQDLPAHQLDSTPVEGAEFAIVGMVISALTLLTISVVLCRHGVEISKQTEESDDVVLLSASSLNQMLPEEILVRASVKHVGDPKEDLLRATINANNIPPEQLLRSAPPPD